jgi:isochorismate synthase
MEQQSFPLSKTLKASIEYLIKKNFAFVLFSHPLSTDFQLIVDQGNSEGEQFCLHSFDNREHIELKGRMYLNEDILEAIKLKNSRPIKLNSLKSNQYLSQGEYERYVVKIIQSIKRSEISKCVAARKKKVPLNIDFSIADTFLDMYIKNQSAFCYISNTSAGLWMGATPELLLAKKDHRYFTVALAGTKIVEEKRDWTDKERAEHQVVVHYIKDVITSNGFEVAETSSVFDAGMKNILHLKMDINFYADKSLHQELHPTPAVCGLPVAKAKNIILNHESDTRSLYAGYLGLEGEFARYYVNLRCMQIFAEHADVHVGAGIMGESDPNKEWLETEVKAAVMENLLKN